MGDGRQREVQGDGNKGSNQQSPLREEAYKPPVGRARYGGVAPAASEIGKEQPSTSDPYFKPPQAPPERQPERQPDRQPEKPPAQNQTPRNDGRDPFLRPPTDQNQPGRAQPFLGADGFPGGQGQEQAPAPGNRDLRPQDEGLRWKPNVSHDWSQPQPGQQGGADQALKDAMSGKSTDLSRARQREHGHFMANSFIGGLGAGLATEPLSKGAGLLADRFAGRENILGSGARWYQQGFDPLRMHSAQLVKESTVLQTSFKELKALADLDQAVLKGLAEGKVLQGNEAKHLETLRTSLGVADDATMLQRLTERTARFNPAKLMEMDSAATNGLAKQIQTIHRNTGTKLFTAQELKLLETRATQLEKVATMETLANSAPERARWLSPGGAWQNFKTGFMGTATSFGLIEANRSLKSHMYGSDFQSWETDSLLVPLSVAASMTKTEAALLHAAAKQPSTLSKLGKMSLYAGGALALGHAVDHYGPSAPSWLPDSLSRTTMYDAVPTGLAMTLPVKDIRYRLGLVAASWALGNVADEVFAGRNSPGDISDNAATKVSEDKTARSFSSMETAVESYKELGDRRFVLLEEALGQSISNMRQNYKDMSDGQKLGSHRELSILTRAMAEHRLEKGVRLDAGSTKTPEYLLRGLNMDLGGTALTNFQAARGNMEVARELTSRKLMGNTVDGTKVTEQEVKDLNQSLDKVNGQINSILGKHDLQKAMTELQRFLDKGTTSDGAIFNNQLSYINTFYRGFNDILHRNMPKMRNAEGRLDVNISPDTTQLVAKVLRDQALARLAQAAFILDKGDDPVKAAQILFGTDQGRNEPLVAGGREAKGYDGALETIMLAEKLSPHNPDLPELKAIAQRLATEARNKIPGQYDDPTKNPLSVDRTGK